MIKSNFDSWFNFRNNYFRLNLEVKEISWLTLCLLFVLTQQVSQQAVSWIPLFQLGCHPDTQLFLCSLFTPVWVSIGLMSYQILTNQNLTIDSFVTRCLDHPIPPCRSLCVTVRDSCSSTMRKYGYPWPSIVECNQFPVDNDMCITAQHGAGGVIGEQTTRRPNPSSSHQGVNHHNRESYPEPSLVVAPPTGRKQRRKGKNNNGKKGPSNGNGNGGNQENGGKKSRLGGGRNRERHHQSSSAPVQPSPPTTSDAVLPPIHHHLLPMTVMSHHKTSSNNVFESDGPAGKVARSEPTTAAPSLSSVVSSLGSHVIASMSVNELDSRRQLHRLILSRFCHSTWSLKTRASTVTRTKDGRLVMKLRNYRVLHGRFGSSSDDSDGSAQVEVIVPANLTGELELRGLTEALDARRRYYLMGETGSSGVNVATLAIPWPHKMGQFR